MRFTQKAECIQPHSPTIVPWREATKWNSLAGVVVATTAGCACSLFHNRNNIRTLEKVNHRRERKESFQVQQQRKQKWNQWHSCARNGALIARAAWVVSLALTVSFHQERTGVPRSQCVIALHSGVTQIPATVSTHSHTKGFFCSFPVF